MSARPYMPLKSRKSKRHNWSRLSPAQQLIMEQPSIVIEKLPGYNSTTQESQMYTLLKEKALPATTWLLQLEHGRLIVVNGLRSLYPSFHNEASYLACTSPYHRCTISFSVKQPTSHPKVGIWLLSAQRKKRQALIGISRQVA